MSESKQPNRVALRAKPTEFISHWSKLVENFQFSSQEFYARVEKALADRQVPDMRVGRVEWMEGGFLSARREYLRIRREWLVFDVCAAPFGTGFFVSMWFGQKRRSILFAVLCLLFAVLVLIDWLTRTPYGLFWAIWTAWRVHRSTVSWILLGVMILSALAGVVGFLYQRRRKMTYYRIDLAAMYQAAVHAAVVQVIDEITKPHGIQALSESERQPLFRELLQWQGGNGRN